MHPGTSISALASPGLVRPSALHPKRDYKSSGAPGFRKSSHPLVPSSHTQTVLQRKLRLIGEVSRKSHCWPAGGAAGSRCTWPSTGVRTPQGNKLRETFKKKKKTKSFPAQRERWGGGLLGCNFFLIPICPVIWLYDSVTCAVSVPDVCVCISTRVCTT